MRRLDIQDWGADVAYEDAVARQEKLLSDRAANLIPDTLALLEHEPVFTLGRSARTEHLVWNSDELARRGIARATASRGGNVTYHGPGQLVGYPIIHLGQAGLSLLDYINALEETLIRTLAIFGVSGTRDRRNRGVWLGNDKVAAIGIRVSRQITMHGFALNVSTRLDDYRGIVPCGLRDVGVTSLQAILGRAPEMSAVKAAISTSFRQVCGYDPL